MSRRGMRPGLSHRSRAGRRSLALAGSALATVVLIRATPSALQGQGGGAPQMVPVAASSVAQHPDAYLGQHVSMMAAVDQIVSPTLFVVDQDKTKTADATVLVVAPTLQAAPALNAYVTVIGDVIRLDAVEMAKRAGDRKIDLPPDVIARYGGKPIVLATSVIDAAMEDLAKVPPPPLSPEEAAFSEVMQAVGPAATALRAALGSSSADQVTEQTAILKKGFADAESFFKGRKMDEPAGWASEARAQVEAVEKAAKAGSWEAANTASASLNQFCQRCHGAYRVRLEDGSYRVKGDR